MSFAAVRIECSISCFLDLSILLKLSFLITSRIRLDKGSSETEVYLSSSSVSTGTSNSCWNLEKRGCFKRAVLADGFCWAPHPHDKKLWAALYNATVEKKSGRLRLFKTGYVNTESLFLGFLKEDLLIFL